MNPYSLALKVADLLNSDFPSNLTQIPQFLPAVLEQCGDHEFQCQDQVCISVDQVCDGTHDCPDSSDEYNCGIHDTFFGVKIVSLQ